MYDRRWKIFKLVDFIHHFYKKFVRRELEKFYGKKWAKEGLPDYLYSRFCSSGFNWDKTKIYLSDFTAILGYKNNWKDIFSLWFEGKTLQEVQKNLISLSEKQERYHADHLTEDEVKEIENLVIELLSNEAKEEFEKVMKGEKLTATEVTILGPLIFQLNGISTAEELAQLTDLPINIVKMILRQSFIRMGLVSMATIAELKRGVIAGAPTLDRATIYKHGEEIFFITMSKEEMLKKYPELSTWGQENEF